ncbi:hypothetical protein TUM12370_33980 [Salmonella enterica subsp. enterica serovar Choleraesuis]|nr:hypothetical protein TUM12370_33980 [Salmonella enterica subsp. enterica serovar Choleraesuis]
MITRHLRCCRASIFSTQLSQWHNRLKEKNNPEANVDDISGKDHRRKKAASIVYINIGLATSSLALPFPDAYIYMQLI